MSAPRIPTEEVIRRNQLSFQKRRAILDEANQHPERSVLTRNTIDPATVDVRIYGHHRSASPSQGLRQWVFESEARAHRFLTNHKRHLP